MFSEKVKILKEFRKKADKYITLYFSFFDLNRSLFVNCMIQFALFLVNNLNVIQTETLQSSFLIFFCFQPNKFVTLRSKSRVSTNGLNTVHSGGIDHYSVE